MADKMASAKIQEGKAAPPQDQKAVAESAPSVGATKGLDTEDDEEVCLSCGA